MRLREYEKSFLRDLPRIIGKLLLWLVAGALAVVLVVYLRSWLTLAAAGAIFAVIWAALSWFFGLFTLFEWCVLILLCIGISAVHGRLTEILSEVENLSAILDKGSEGDDDV
jgi:hypothetical protein